MNQIFWFLAAGTYQFTPPSGLTLTLSEILPDLSPDPAAATVTQHIGRNTVSYQPGQQVAAGLPVTFTVSAPCTVAFSSPMPGLQVVATPTAAGDLENGQQELVLASGSAPVLRVKHADVMYALSLPSE